ncbi:MAG: ATP-binding protein [Firmicutes bacterium]|nr:ATP-binding protein [Bacillota bacterium]
MALEPIRPAVKRHSGAKVRGGWATAADLRRLWPPLSELAVEDAAVLRAQAEIRTVIAQERVCGACQGYERCGKVGDARGMYDRLSMYQGELFLQTAHCQPFHEYQAVRLVERYRAFATRTAFDRACSFTNFPEVQRHRHPQTVEAARKLADDYRVGASAKGLYVFGPAGVGKTHLLNAIVNRLEERRIPVIIVQAEAMFDRLRREIGEGKEIDHTLEAFATVPVLALDEIGQERANEFTLEKLFRVINHRFSAQLPTLFASNYAPPDLYRRLPADFVALTDPLKSRIIGMTRCAYMDGEDFRTASMEMLDR